MLVLAGRRVEKLIRTWVGEMGVIRGWVRISVAVTLVSWLVCIVFKTLGITVMAVKMMTTGMRTAKADFMGMPQSL